MNGTHFLPEESEFGKRRAQNADLWNKTLDPPKRPKFPGKRLCEQRVNINLHMPKLNYKPGSRDIGGITVGSLISVLFDSRA